MAASFPPDARILRFDPRLPQEYHGRRQDLLWPVWAYRVVVPESLPAELMDPFQRAVFGMMLHGIVDPVDIAGQLCLHPDLVRIVQAYLENRSLIDAQKIVKKDAEIRYRNARFQLGEQIDRFTTGYVFQDPFSGLLLPRLVRKLEQADVTILDSGFPALRLGERTVRPFTELPPPTRPPAPGQADVLGAADAFQRVRQRSRSTDDVSGTQFLGRVQRVNFIEDQPELMFLSTFVFGEGQGSWEVADPFGLPTSPLTALVHQQARRSPMLAQLAVRLAGEEQATAALVADPQQEALERLQQLHTGVDDHPLLQVMLDAELAHQELLEASELNRKRRAQALLLASRLLLEHTMRQVRARYSTRGVDRQLLDGDRHYNLQRLEAAASTLGYDVPLAPTITRVKVSDVHWMANREDSGKLRPLLAALLLSAAQHDGHPLRSAASDHPNLLHLLNEALGAGGQGVHAGGTETDVPLDQMALRTLAAAHVAARLLCPARPTTDSAPVVLSDLSYPPASTFTAAVPKLRVAAEPIDTGIDDLDL
jgi:hypothetical protein